MEQKIRFTNSIMDVTNKLFPKLTKEYTLANIKREQEKDKRKTNRFLITLLVGGFVLISASLSYRYYVDHYTLPKNLLAVTSEDSTKQKSNIIPNKHKGSKTKFDISFSKEHSIIKHLTAFEKKQKFLQKNLSLNRLASLFNTNDKYLSQIIKQRKGKTFLAYLNDLRLDYILDQLNNNKKYRYFKINILADESGFSNVQSFIRSFKSRTGTVPTKDIQILRKQNSEES